MRDHLLLPIFALAIACLVLGYNIGYSFARYEGSNQWTDGVITATFDEKTGTLTFSGEGAVYHAKDWVNVKPQLVKKMVFADGINYVRDCEFSGGTGPISYVNLEEIVFEGDLIEIGDCAFGGNVNLKKVEFQKGCSQIGTLAFYHCLSLEDINMPDGCEYRHGNLMEDAKA